MSSDASDNGLYFPTEVAKLYNFPLGTGAGQRIAILESSGTGYSIDALKHYFLNTLGLPQAPVVNPIKVGKATFDPQSTSGEVYLDIEVAGGIAYGATLNVYFAEHLAAAVEKAIADDNDIITMSIGGLPEQEYETAYRERLDALFRQAANQGITVLHGAGDAGSWRPKVPPAPTATDCAASVAYPASSPWVTACGGTDLHGSGSVIKSEVVWSQSQPATPQNGAGATGGGVSEIYAVPDYQLQAGLNPTSVNSGNTGRGVPDVAAMAGTTYKISIAGGPLQGVHGDSATGPLWAALIAIINQAIGTRVGFLNPILYTYGVGNSDAFRDIQSGSNQYRYQASANSGIVTVPGYEAGPGWDACTGYGSPNGQKLLSALIAKFKS